MKKGLIIIFIFSKPPWLSSVISGVEGQDMNHRIAAPPHTERAEKGHGQAGEPPHTEGAEEGDGQARGVAETADVLPFQGFPLPGVHFLGQQVRKSKSMHV